MSRTWLTERVKDVQNASQRYEASRPKVDCSGFLKIFEKQLHDNLHLKNFLPENTLHLPIQKGCYDAVESLFKANGVKTSSLISVEEKKSADKIILLLSDHELYMTKGF